jgi:hypothetical protein
VLLLDDEEGEGEREILGVATTDTSSFTIQASSRPMKPLHRFVFF